MFGLLADEAIFAKGRVSERGALRGVASGVGGIVTIGGRVVVITKFVADENGFGEPDVSAAAVVAAGRSGLKQMWAGGHAPPVEVVAAFDQFNPRRLCGEVVEIEKSETTAAEREGGLVVKMGAGVVAVVGRENPLRFAPRAEIGAVREHATAVVALTVFEKRVVVAGAAILPERGGVLRW